MSKKIILIAIAVFLFFMGFIAITQETTDSNLPVFVYDHDYENDIPAEENGEMVFDLRPARETPDWVKPERWFFSNAGGMALEESSSRYAALRGEYALVIDFTDADELPEYLKPFYENDFFIEIRKLYKNGEESRKQWIFRDENGTTRLIAVLSLIEFDEEPEENDTEETDIEIIPVSVTETKEELIEPENFETETEIETDATEAEYELINNEIIEDEDAKTEKEIEEDNEINIVKIEYFESESNFLEVSLIGFIEIYSEESFITSEYRFYDDGSRTKTNYFYNNELIIKTENFMLEENHKHLGYIKTHTDHFRYNRSYFLRGIERIFSIDQDITRVSFPSNIMEAARGERFVSERLNPFPEFFGDLFVKEDTRLVFTSDERGRVLTQTLYNNDEENSIIWTIVNTWVGERIVSIEKTEGETVLTAEYAYDSSDNRILERNLRNGVLERVVRTEGNTDIEELYLNGVFVLQAVWEDGRKLSETRIRNN